MEADNIADSIATNSINGTLPFKPICPKCGADIEIFEGVVGYHANCGACGSDFAASRFSSDSDAVKWLYEFDGSRKKKEKSSEEDGSENDMPQKPNSKKLVEIAHSSEVLKQAIQKVQEAYSLVVGDKVARRYINFSSSLVWVSAVWDILLDEYNKAKPDSKDIYFLRAFDYFGIQCGVDIGECTARGRNER